MMEALVNAHVVKPEDVAHELKSAGSGYTEEQVKGWLKDDTYPGKDSGLTDQDRSSLNDAIWTIMGDKKLLDATDYDQTYRDAFHNYFKKGDGDGN
jgi:hypothetical protein